jgi:hypothetical protein
LVTALEIAARAYVLEEGRIAAEGAPKELLAAPHIRRVYLGESWSSAAGFNILLLTYRLVHNAGTKQRREAGALQG